MTVNDSYEQVVERILQSADIEELRRAVIIYRDTLSAVTSQRDELRVKYETACKRGSVWFNNYMCTRYALICTRLDLNAAEAMIRSLLNPGHNDLRSNDLDIV